jgi:hypothetical protein
MTPFTRPDIPFPESITTTSGIPLSLGSHVQARLPRRVVTGEVVGWRMPDRVRILTSDCHLHTVPLEELLAQFDEF